MVWTPIDLMPKHHEVTAPLWRQLVGVSYLWWALATLVADRGDRRRADRYRDRAAGIDRARAGIGLICLAGRRLRNPRRRCFSR